jgi:hypothetical protein
VKVPTRLVLFAVAISALAATDELSRPADYREWIYLSSGIGMTYGPNANAAEHPPFDNVFVNPEAYRAFLKTGSWPDGTMFVLEIRASTSEGSINKGGHFQTAVRAIEVETKRNGVWTFYGFNPPDAKTGKALPRSAACYSCHAEHGAVDNTFVQFYPTLIDVARAKGTFKESPAR